MANTGDIGVGTFIRFNGELCHILEYQHRTPGNLRAFYQAKMRNVRTGKLLENRFRAGESVDVVRVEFKEYQYIFPENGSIVVMDTESYEQIYIPEELLGDSLPFLKEGVMVKVSFEGDNPISAEPPTFVELEVTYTEPGLKGDTATNTLKPATLETGAKINIPLFVNQGEKIKIDTRDKSYVERVK